MLKTAHRMMMKLAREAFNDEIFRYASVVQSEYQEVFKPATIQLLDDLQAQGWYVDLMVRPVVE